MSGGERHEIVDWVKRLALEPNNASQVQTLFVCRDDTTARDDFVGIRSLEAQAPDSRRDIAQTVAGCHSASWMRQRTLQSRKFQRAAMLKGQRAADSPAEPYIKAVQKIAKKHFGSWGKVQEFSCSL